MVLGRVWWVLIVVCISVIENYLTELGAKNSMITEYTLDPGIVLRWFSNDQQNDWKTIEVNIRLQGFSITKSKYRIDQEDLMLDCPSIANVGLIKKSKRRIGNEWQMYDWPRRANAGLAKEDKFRKHWSKGAIVGLTKEKKCRIDQGEKMCSGPWKANLESFDQEEQM